MTTGGAITFEVAGQPVPWARARLQGKRHFTPSHVREYQHLLGYTAAQAMAGRALLEGPVCLEVVAYFPVPKSWPKYRREIIEAGGLVPHAKKPDADNLAKNVKDALNMVVYRDDAQVADQRCRKVYGDRPRVVVSVTPISEGR